MWCSSLRLISFALATIVAGPVAGADLGGALYRMVVLGSTEAVPEETLPDPARRWLREFLERGAAFRSLRPVGEPPVGLQLRLEERRLALERCAVALIHAEGVEEAAASLANEALMYSEWEGMSDCPLAEAAWVEEHLDRNPGTPLRPLLHLVAAHRLRCAAETLAHEGNTAARNKALGRYRALIEASRRDPNPLVRLAADDMDAQPYLYLQPIGGKASVQAIEPSRDLIGSSAPALTIEEAIRLARLEVDRRGLDPAGQHIASAVLRYDDKVRSAWYWHIQWMWSQPRLGGELSANVSMDGSVELRTLGP